MVGELGETVRLKERKKRIKGNVGKRKRRIWILATVVAEY